jgi:2-iminoacetate synthase
MGFYKIIEKYSSFDFSSFFAGLTQDDVLNAVSKDNLDTADFLALLSPKAEPFIEKMAQKAHALTLNNFGRAVLLYTPLYLSNYCENKCVYCGFNCENKVERRKLTLEEVDAEARFISSKGLKHILILTGGSRQHSPLSYIIECIDVLKKYFTSISIEIYALEGDEYKKLIDAGVDGVTIYQEVYDEDVYNKVHVSGAKKDYSFRLDAPQRACENNIRSVNIGSLLGLSDFRKETFFTGLHADYLQDKYRDTEVSISVPRIQRASAGYAPSNPVTDKNLAQIIAAFRIFMPRAGITLSTREASGFRDNILPLGITRMSAESSTSVGGRISLECSSSAQFDISDSRSVENIRSMLLSRGYQPVFKDWMAL